MADKSLDEIIQERKIGGSRGRGRGRGAFRGGRTGIGAQGGGRGQRGNADNSQVTMPNKSQVIQSLMRRNTFRPGQAVAVTVPDARDKLILKARQTDAREKLNKKARLVDVRVKLNAKRQLNQQWQQQQQSPGGDVPLLQGAVAMEQARNPAKRKLTEITINNPSVPKQHQMSGLPQVTINNNQTKGTGGGGANSGRVLLGSDGLQITTTNKSAQKRQARQQLQLQRTVPVEDSLEEDLVFQPVSAKFKKIAAQAPPQPQANIKTTIQGDACIFGFSARDLGSPFKLGNVQQTSLLQRSAAQTPLTLQTQGTRLIVNNLHSSVSEADIKELYGDVGELKKARLVRSGLAEVIYIKREHALEAIARYHNRELDGLPMQCKLDTSTVPEASGIHIPVMGKLMSMNERFKLIGGGATGTTDFSLSTIGMRSDAIAPSGESVDASTVHRALFKTGAASAAAARPVVFTVKI